MRKLTKRILTTGLLSTASAIALAGGGINMPTAANFTGLYGGAQMGVSSGNMHTDSVDGFIITDNNEVTADNTNVAAGIFAGYGKQFNNNLYLGLNGDLNWMNSYFKENIDLSFIGLSLRDFQIVKKISPTYSADVELGYVINQTVLLFITGGYAGASVNNDTTITETTGETVTYNNNTNPNGYNLGIGMRAMLTKNIFLQGKGTYTSLGKTNSTNLTPSSVTTITTSFKPEFYQILFGIGYKL